MQNQTSDQHPSLFASGEPSYREFKLLGTELKACRPSIDMNRPFAIDNRVALRGERASQRYTRIELLAFLVEVEHSHAFGALHGAAVRIDFAGENTEQGSLAAAVRPQEPQASPRGENKRKIFEKLAPTERLVEMFGLD